VWFPETGYEWLPRVLADGIDVRVSTPVQHIEWGPDGVRVRSALAEHAATHAVVTLPVGVLRAGTVGFNAGTYARRLTPLDDAAVVADAMQVLRTIYG
jgi:monoamine oxidase